MRSCLIASVLLAAIPAAVDGQLFPRLTAEREKALTEMLRRCVAAGGLSVSKDPKSGAVRYAVADVAKVKTAVAPAATCWGRACATP